MAVSLSLSLDKCDEYIHTTTYHPKIFEILWKGIPLEKSAQIRVIRVIRVLFKSSGQILRNLTLKISFELIMLGLFLFILFVPCVSWAE